MKQIPSSVENLPKIYIKLRDLGKAVTGWTGLQVVRAIDAAADVFTFSLPFDPTPENYELFHPYRTENSVIEVFADSERFITGYIEIVTCLTDGDTRTINLQGRSTTGVLMDWSAGSLYSATPPHFPKTQFEFSNMTFNQIAKVIAFPNEVKAAKRNPVTGALEDFDTGVIADVSIEPGESIFQFLSKLAAANGLFSVPLETGGLRFMKLGTGSPVVDLEEGKQPVISVESTHDVTKRFFQYQIIATTTGQPGVMAQSFDTGVNAGRRGSKVIEPRQQSADYKEAANLARARGFIDSYNVSVNVAGFVYQDYSGTERFWKAGDLLRLKAPGAFVRKMTPYIVKQVTFQFDETQGQRTKLDLTLPEAYSGNQPTSKPWEQ